MDKIYQELGVQLFERAPGGFDPIKADASELSMYGYPPRPNRQRDPARYVRWARVVPSLKVIQPEFEIISRVAPQRPPRPVVVDPGKPHGPVKTGPANPPGGNRLPDTPQPSWNTSQGWAGSVDWAPHGEPITSVHGVWTVPHVVTPTGGSGPFVCATWIGIDGWLEVADTNLVQMGTTQQPDSTPFAWWQWLPGHSVKISNFPVSLGDTMQCVLTAISPTSVTFQFINRTASIMAPLIMEPNSSDNPMISHTPILGSCAEWIVERPLQLNGMITNLAEFGSIIFTDAFAIAGRQTLLAGSGELITMQNHDIDIATPSVIGSEAIQIDFGS